MKDPIGAYEQLQQSIKKYITTAFRTNSESFEIERQQLLDTPGVLFQHAFVEPLPEYKSGKKLQDLSDADLPGMSERARSAFTRIASAGLFSEGYPLYTHQQEMLRRSLSGNHCVVVTGTGSGKTESFLLPLLASVVREGIDKTPWHEVSGKEALWNETSPPDWEGSRRLWRGEKRTAAMRALVLYPMNALVEDQVSRLRKALDSDAVHEALNSEFGRNRIRFGRYNGATPVSGHPFNSDGKANGHARARLKQTIKRAMKNWTQASGKLAGARERLKQATLGRDVAGIALARQELRDAEDLTAFVPRLEVDAAELFHRWEMQADPPDILVTNVSMLSIMLMRHRDPSLSEDRADSDIFDKTKKWLAESEEHVFTLVVDELHLYRGTAGTEVAYLIRLLLNRLGLSPTDKKLRILASSASLDGAAAETYEFLGGFFGLAPESARKAFHVESGQPRLHAAHDAAFRDEPAVKLQELGREIRRGAVQERSLQESALQLLKTESNLAGKLLAAFGPGKARARSLEAVAGALFPSIPAPEDRLEASRGLFALLSELPRGEIDLPRFRFHWMAKNVDGLWAVAAGASADKNRRVGKLFPEPTIDPAHGRVLEVLYCECCGTQLLAGHKIELRSSDLNGSLANPSRIPGMASAGGVKGFELTSINADLGALPEQYADARTDSQPYTRLGVVWIPPGDWDVSTYKAIEWEQRSESADASSNPVERADASWLPAKMDPQTGIVRIGHDSRGAEGVDCLWFHLKDVSPNSTLPAMPQRCPSCLIDYTERRGRPAPIRSFVTGLARMSHLLTKHLMVGLSEQGSPQLVAFSDSREGAATLAVGVEDEQWQHLLRVFLLRQLLRQSSGGLRAAKRAVLVALEKDGAKIAAEVLKACAASLTEEETHSLRAFAKSAKAVLESPEFANQEDVEKVESARVDSQSYVRLDEVLGSPTSTESRLLKGIWRDFVSVGVNPAGTAIDQQSLGGGERDWTSVFGQTDSRLLPELRKDLTERGRADLQELVKRLRTSAWRAISGRLLYDLEAQGLGHFALPPTSDLKPPQSMPLREFRAACESVIRILTEEKRTDPSQRDAPEKGWEFSVPKEGGRERSPAKVRVLRYLSRVAERNGSVSYETLRDAVSRALHGSGHAAIDNGWGVISLGYLWVRVASRSEVPWVCGRCGQLHWHSSAGVCSRCVEPLSVTANGSLSAGQIAQAHYNASEARDERSAFRLHTEELTGQTEDQAQRQRHFRGIFFDDDEISLVAPRNALKNVDAIDLLSVTTTMEVGVDIGALQAIFQANMPPERFNYQQRSGRAGRQGQRYSAVLTYCRGQTHDRIHFDHPEEMTGGDPPPPTLALGAGQRMLADRLVAKEVLRLAFRSMGLAWKDSGSPPDSHGEMGTVENWRNESLRAKLEAWLRDNEELSRDVVRVISRATSQSTVALMEGVCALPTRIHAAVENGEFVTQQLAHRLAEAGILPMYGMPTNVRSLYYSLRTGSGDPADTDARALDRDFDQAVSEFVPGARRTWDKRLLTPSGLVGRVRKILRGDWEVQDTPVGAAFIHIFCADCRRLFETVANASTLQPENAPSWWQSSWTTDFPRDVVCPGCGSNGARIYKAVAPRGFITDLDLGTPATQRMQRDAGAPPAHVLSPKFSGAKAYKALGACHLSITTQGRVYRTNRNGGRLFQFDSWKFMEDPQTREKLRGDGRIWRTHKSGSSRPAFEVAIVSPKTTDLLAIRAYDERGLEFFDNRPELAGRRAAWYSAATILQRAIALELDVDSLDIEIASVHRLHDGLLGGGAELYLADAHPNGAGLVSWCSDHWEKLVRGALTGTGSLQKLGTAIREEMTLAISKPWRSPDLLLRGFRNRSIHGLLDHSLGMDLLASLLDSKHSPGVTAGVEGFDRSIQAMPDWSEHARKLSEQFVKSFGRIAAPLKDAGDLSGWVETDAEHCMAVVVHPLWAAYPGSCNRVRDAMEYAQKKGMKQLRLIDSFNLSRRMAWVRARRDLFLTIDLESLGSGEVVLQQHQGDNSGEEDGPSGSGDGHASSVHTTPTKTHSDVSVGEVTHYQGRRYVRVTELPLYDAGPGDVLVRTGSGMLHRALIRRPAGLDQPKVKLHGGGVMTRDEISTGIVVARGLEEEDLSGSPHPGRS